ncbi:hypothetical protein RHGRI_029480 [Rhododendron griersonianum]|uniref:Uncoupling protein 3 n=1 Tax=Rhododendron griersonianum TaxID=479676 RepID=A0AAV6IK49_9ERIC|nr:hypothetical protein RHGRI_029480 [Rhododendron griersonianum]
MLEVPTPPREIVPTRVHHKRFRDGRMSLGPEWALRAISIEGRGNKAVQGLDPGDYQTPLLHPIRIVGYEHLRTAFFPDDRPVSLSSKALIGGVSGVFAQFFVNHGETTREGLGSICLRINYGPVKVIASPADLIKVRMQADGRMISQGLQPRYSGPFDALNKILRKEGIVGLWKGVFPNVQRAFLVNMGELACYDHAKRLIIQNQIAGDNIYAHTLASIMSGLSATALSCPADVVKTRVMNQTVSNEGKVKYRNSFHCLVKTVRVEGLGALWKGFFPTWARLGPWQFVFWVSYEKFRQAAGLSSF